MLTKTEFVKAIEAIKKIDDKLNKNIKDRNLRVALSEYSLKDDMIFLLESAMAIPAGQSHGSIISWWIYENDFGRQNLDIRYVDNNNEFTNEKIKTPKELYEYCKDMSAED